MLLKTDVNIKWQKPHAETEKDPRFNGMANATHCHPNKFALPKAFQTIRDANRLAFLTLPNLRVQAPDVVSH